MCNHLDKSYCALLSYGAVYHAVKSVTIQINGIAQCFLPVLFIMRVNKVVLTFESVDEILIVTIQMKAIEQYFPMVLFIMLYKVVLTFESNEILKCGHSTHESCFRKQCFHAAVMFNGSITFEWVDVGCLLW